jgi:hypothetical protein
MITEKNVRLTGWRFQFRLRSLFGLVTAAAIAIGLVGYADRRLSDEARAARNTDDCRPRERTAARQSDCGSYPRDDVWEKATPRAPVGWDLTQIRPEYVSVHGLHASGKSPAARAARELDRFPRLSRLALTATSLKDEDSQLLWRLKGLKELDLSSTQLNGLFVHGMPGDAPLVGSMSARRR